MRAYENGDAAGCQFVQFVPEVAAGRGIDAGRGFIEKQEIGPVKHAGPEGHALLPAAGERACQLLRAAGQAELLKRLFHGASPVRDLKEPRHEIQVFPDGEIFPEGEALGHVADVPAYLHAVLHNIPAEACPCARVRSEQAAHHAYAGGLAAAVGAEEAVDLAAFHGHGHVIHHRFLPEPFGQAVHVDGGRRGLRPFFSLGIHRRTTLTGCPGCRPAAVRSSISASAMKQSLLRVSLE